PGDRRDRDTRHFVEYVVPRIAGYARHRPAKERRSRPRWLDSNDLGSAISAPRANALNRSQVDAPKDIAFPVAAEWRQVLKDRRGDELSQSELDLHLSIQGLKNPRILEHYGARAGLVLAA